MQFECFDFNRPGFSLSEMLNNCTCESDRTGKVKNQGYSIGLKPLRTNLKKFCENLLLNLQMVLYPLVRKHPWQALHHCCPPHCELHHHRAHLAVPSSPLLTCSRGDALSRFSGLSHFLSVLSRREHLRQKKTLSSPIFSSTRIPTQTRPELTLQKVSPF